MEEQNKNPEKKENEVQTSQENIPQNATPTRSYVLMILAGCYLLYTGYRLCKNVIDGVDGGSWGFFAAGIGFLIVGAVMLLLVVRILSNEIKKNVRWKKLPWQKKKRQSRRKRQRKNDEYCGTCETGFKS